MSDGIVQSHNLCPGILGKMIVVPVKTTHECRAAPNDTPVRFSSRKQADVELPLNMSRKSRWMRAG